MNPKSTQTFHAITLGLALAGISMQSAHAVDGTWAVDTTGNWSSGSSWVGGLVADGIGATATFNADNTAPRTATIDTTSRTLGILNLSGSNTATSGTPLNWSLASSGGATLTFDNTGVGNAQINVVNRNTGITSSLPMLLNSNLDLNKSGVTGTTLALSGLITGTNRTINVNGTGTTQTVAVGNASLSTSFVNGTWVINNAVLNMNAGFKGDGTTKVTLGTGTGSSTLQINSATFAAGNTITVASGGTGRTLQSVSGTVTTSSLVLNGDLTTVVTTTLNLAGVAGSTITGIGGIVSTFNTVNIAGAASNTGTNQASGGNINVTTGSLNGSSTQVLALRTFNLNDNADYTFDIGLVGVNDAITGTGSAILDGDFAFNLTGANTTVGNMWQIVSVGTLSEAFGSTFTVAHAGAIETANVWAFTNAGTNYQFSELSGQLTVLVPEPNVAALLGSLGVLTLLRRRR